MTVTGSSTNVNEPALEELKIKIMMFLRDDADMNILLDDVEFSDLEYRCAIDLAVSGYNVMTPATAVDYSGVPEYVLFHWVAGLLMRSNTFLQARNQVSVPTDNIGVIGLDDKAGLYASMAQSLIGEAKQVGQKYKNQQNLESAYGCLPSGYAHVSRFQQN